MKRIFISALILFLSSVLSAAAQDSRVEVSSQDLDSGTLSFTTEFLETDPGYLSYVSVSFSGAPESSETIRVFVKSRHGTSYNALLVSTTTTAATTTNVLFMFNGAIPITGLDQITVTCTNASQSTGEVNDDPTAYVAVSLDNEPRGVGNGVEIWKDGVFSVSSTLHDYRFHTGDILPDANQQLGSFYLDISQIAAPASPSAGTRRLFVDSGSGEFSVRTSSGTTVSLEESGNAFETINAPSGDDPVADSSTDTLNLTSSSSELLITGNATTDTIDFILVDGSLTESLLAAVDLPADEECLTYESTVGDFEWQACGGGGGTGDITAVGFCSTGDCGIEGGTDVFPLLYEGTANTEETTFYVTEPTSDRTVTFQDLTGYVALQDNVLTAASIPFVNTSAQLDENTEFVWDNTNERIGIGATSPSVVLDVASDLASGEVTSWFTGYGAGAPALRFRAAGGSKSSPSAITSGSTIGAFGAMGYHSSNAFHTNPAADIIFQAAEDFTSSAQGSRFFFRTVPTGSTTRTEVMRLDENQRVGIGTTTPDTVLDVEGGAISVSEVSAPSTPASGKGAVYAKSDSKLYYMNDGGTEYDLTVGGSSVGFVMNGGDNTGLTATFYVGLGSAAASSATEDATEVIIPDAITCTSIYTRVDQAPGVGNSWAACLRDDGVNTSLCCTISGTNTTCNATGSATLAAGSLINVEFAETGTAASTTGQSAAVKCSF